MTMYGANPEQLAHLGRTLSRQITTIEQMTALVDAALAGTVWQGPARQRFEQDWQGSFKQALGRLNEAFAAAGQDCVVRSQELQRVMGT
jgi:uncharacterized protein YukE